MAFAFVSNHGSVGVESSAASIAVGVAVANIPVGRLAYAYFVSDNQSSGEDTTLHQSVADSKGNTWTKVKEVSGRTGAAADSGSTTSLWYSVITTELVASTDTVTLTLSTAKVARVGCLTSYSFANGVQLDDANGSPQHSTTPSVTSATLASASRLWLGLMGQDHGGTLGFSEDGDYTSRQNIGSGSNNTSGVRVWLAERIATLTADTYNPTKTTAADESMIIAAFQDVADALEHELTAIQVVRDLGQSVGFEFGLTELEAARAMLTLGAGALNHTLQTLHVAREMQGLALNWGFPAIQVVRHIGVNAIALPGQVTSRRRRVTAALRRRRNH